MWLILFVSLAQPPGKGGGKGGGGGAPGGATYKGIHPSSLLGRIAQTDVAGTIEYPALVATVSAGEDIFGPFEAGFSSARQANILQGLGCDPDINVDIAGGLDTHIAEQMIAYVCNITLPRIENGERKSLLDSCGGHTRDYHFHERLKCLYTATNGTGHSERIGTTNTKSQGIYGKWEDSQTYPMSEWCGGHFGPVPDADGQPYHYHVQDIPPFTLACEGPTDDDQVVTRDDCRNTFEDACDGVINVFGTPTGPIAYDLWCPCFDANGSNTGFAPRISDNVAPVMVPASPSPPVSPSPFTPPPFPCPPSSCPPPPSPPTCESIRMTYMSNGCCTA